MCYNGSKYKLRGVIPMELGQKIRQARLEAGMSQRQLCGDTITRNMLSQIENGSASPSMATLRFLAERLGKSVSYFMEEQAVTSSNQQLMDQLRRSFAAGDWVSAWEYLKDYRGPDPVFDWEKGLLESLTLMNLAEKALEEHRRPYAAQLLEQAGAAGTQTPYYGPELERKRLLLLYRAVPQEATMLASRLPDGDPELLLRATAALEQGSYTLSGHLLDSAGNREEPQWNFLRGEVWRMEKQYASAVECYLRAEKALPNKVLPRLEQCYRELGDYKMAYEYACKQR